MQNGQKRITTVLAAETYKNLRIVAAERDMRLAPTIDWLLRKAINLYAAGKLENGDSR